MSSKPAIGCLLTQLWWRHLVNAYEGKAGMVLIAGKTVWSTDPCLSALRACVHTKMALYKYSSFPFPFIAYLPKTSTFGRKLEIDKRVNYHLIHFALKRIVHRKNELQCSFSSTETELASARMFFCSAFAASAPKSSHSILNISNTLW